MSERPPLIERFRGALLGLAIGDALGAQFEGRSPEAIKRRYPSVAALMSDPPPGELWYTDDTQMAIGVAETLIQAHRIDEREICRRFAVNFQPQRGYGRGARIVLEAMVAGYNHRELAANLFPGGSFGNGAAMRVAPVGLVFRHDHQSLLAQARLSALPTHVHPMAIEGAQLLALAVGLASLSIDFDRASFFSSLIDACVSVEYGGPLRRAARIADPKDLALFGNGIEATSSVVTAIACFGLTPNSYEQSIGNAILLGGDSDTIAAMAGAISGAYLGQQAIPHNLLLKLEDRHQGKTYLQQLSEELYDTHLICSRNPNNT